MVRNQTDSSVLTKTKVGLTGSIIASDVKWGSSLQIIIVLGLPEEGFENISFVADEVYFVWKELFLWYPSAKHLLEIFYSNEN